MSTPNPTPPAPAPGVTQTPPATPPAAAAPTLGTPPAPPAAATPPAAPDPTKPPETPPAAAPVVPEKYDIKLPDGMEIDPKALEHYTPVLKELGVTAEGAQKLVDAQLALASQAQKANDEAFTAQVENWGKLSREDKEFGGTAFDTNLVVAQRALAKFGTPDLKKLLDDTGLGNHPEVMRAFVRIGKQIGEDGGVRGADAGGSSPTSLADKFYPKQGA